MTAPTQICVGAGRHPPTGGRHMLARLTCKAGHARSTGPPTTHHPTPDLPPLPHTPPAPASPRPPATPTALSLSYLSPSLSSLVFSSVVGPAGAPRPRARAPDLCADHRPRHRERPRGEDDLRHTGVHGARGGRARARARARRHVRGKRYLRGAALASQPEAAGAGAMSLAEDAAAVLRSRRWHCMAPCGARAHRPRSHR